MSAKYEWSWKIFTALLGVVILPLAGWVWSVNIEVTQLRNDLGDAERSIAAMSDKLKEAEDNARSLIGVNKDIEYMKDILQRIEKLVAR
jgi:hypothetical protein